MHVDVVVAVVADAAVAVDAVVAQQEIWQETHFDMEELRSGAPCCVRSRKIPEPTGRLSAEPRLPPS